MGDFAIIHARTSYTMPDGQQASGRYTDVLGAAKRTLARGVGARFALAYGQAAFIPDAASGHAKYVTRRT